MFSARPIASAWLRPTAGRCALLRNQNVLGSCVRGLAVLLPASGTVWLLSSSTTSRLFASTAPAVSNMPDMSKYVNAVPSPETRDFILQQTMIRVKDPVASLDFYTQVLGFKYLMHLDFPEWSFSVYFVAPPGQHHVPLGPNASRMERWNACMQTPGCVELTWNHGSEKSEGKVYNIGNADATGTGDGKAVKGGFGHLGITTSDVYKACERFHQLGVQFAKSPNSGGMKGLAFIKDPDGYLIEVLPKCFDPKTGQMPTQPVDCLGVRLNGGGGYVDKSKK
eukprot:g28354.t1